jgi:hypothetical protein
MVIGRHACRNAIGTHLREAIAVTLDDAMTWLEESFHDLTDAQAQGFPVSGRNNIAWIVMHCLDNLDGNAVGAQTGARIYPEEPRWDLWRCKPEERPKPGDPFPTVAEMLGRLRRIREAAAAAIDQADERALLQPLGPPGRIKADGYMRTICHTNAHVRQIWLLRGALGPVDGKSWPQQHWAWGVAWPAAAASGRRGDPARAGAAPPPRGNAPALTRTST